MATRVQVIMEDDHDGGPADQTVTFALDGRDYEIDLGNHNAEALRSALAPWIAAARRVGGRRRRTVLRPSDAVDNRAIRAWAHEKGIEVADRGRIPQAIQDQYARENDGATVTSE